MTRRLLKIIFKLIITVSVLECMYLLIVPPVIHKILNKDFICSVVEKNTNILLSAEKIDVKTGIKPAIILMAKNIKAENKLTNIPLVSADGVNFEIALFPLFVKKISPKHLYADNVQLTIKKNEDGIFNFENIFKNQNKSPLKILYDNIEIKTSGSINTNETKSDFDIDLKYSAPFSVENLSNNNIKGSALIYNLNLNELSPLLQKLFPVINKTEGIIDFIQISTDKKDKDTTQAVINAKFKNLLYDQKGWKNYIFAQGENKISSTTDLFEDTVKLLRFKYDAPNVDISSDGTIELKNKPVLDLNVSVKNSRTENIAAILPPALVKETMIIEKVKHYGIYGDMEAEANIKGTVPQPDITGWAKGRNLHILDKDTQKKHTGTVDIVFDKRKLNMDILVEMLNSQKAEIKGTTYIFRDGVNDVTIKTTDKLDFPLAQKIMLPVGKVFDFQLGPLPEMNITQGKGKLDIHVKGNLEFINLDGYCEFDNASFTYNGLYGNVTNVKGRLDLEGDSIKVKSQRAYMENNPFSVDGVVKINNNLDFNISSKNTKTKDLLQIINNSELLKDLKKGLALFKNPNGNMDLSFNITANIVPVPFGHPPLPVEEAFTDMKVKGSASLNGIECYLDGFRTPLNSVKGVVNFTEMTTDFKNLTTHSGKSSVSIDGNIVTDVKTKIPDVDLTITGNSIKTGDTIRFLTESYLYPKNYPDITSLYNLEARHDLYLTYKAKSVDLLTNKIHAVMNMIKNTGDKSIKVQSGRITMDDAIVKADNINADILNSNVNISGNVKKVDTVNPIYDMTIKAEKFNLENLNNAGEINIIPIDMNKLLSQFSDYKGYVDFSTKYKNNILNTSAKFSELSFIHTASSMPVKADDFEVKISDDKLTAKNIAANFASMPVFADLSLSHIYTKPYIDGYITTKINNEFIQKLLPPVIASKMSVSGDINISSYIKGTRENFELKPQITLYPEAYAVLSGVKIADSAEKRIFESDIQVAKDIINIKNVDYYKYITTQNDTVYPALFAYGNGMLAFNDKTGMYEPKNAYIKTEKSLSAKLLNVFMNKPLFKQGTVTCDLKYDNDSIKGSFDAKNIDIPIFDTVIKNIKLNTDKENINVKLFGFINETSVRAETSLDNNLKKAPHIDTLKVYADKIDTNKLLSSISNVRSEFNTKKAQNNSPDLSVFEIEDGELHVDEITVKNYTAENLDSKFSINKDGIFNIKDINVKLGEGSGAGEIFYNLKNSEIKAELEFKNVDSNYLAENLFDAKNQIFGIANANFFVTTNGNSDEDLIKNLSGFAYFDMAEGKMPKLGSLEYLLRASNIVKNGVTGFSLNNVLELLNLVKTGYFTSITGSCKLENGLAKDVEIFSKGENLSLYLHGDYSLTSANADMEILGKLSNKISTIFGPIGNASLNTFFKHIPGVSLLDFGRKDLIENVEKIPSFTGGDYDSRTFQAIIKGDINSSGYVQSFKWVKQ